MRKTPITSVIAQL